MLEAILFGLAFGLVISFVYMLQEEFKRWLKRHRFKLFGKSKKPRKRKANKKSMQRKSSKSKHRGYRAIYN